MSYLADFCKMTSSTGGTGALTLTAQTGYPALSDAITGTRLCSYSITEYTTSGKTTLSKAETGIGSYVASTGVLTRTTVKTTWDGTNYLPKFGTSTAPSAVSFGSTAANIDVTVSPIVSDIMTPFPFQTSAVASVFDGLGCVPANFTIPNTTFAFVSGQTEYFLIYLPISKQYSQFTIRTTTTLTGGAPTCDCAIYEINSAGFAGKRLISFTQITAIGTTNTTYTSSALATPIYLPAGWYWCGMLYLAASATGTFTPRSASSGVGSNSTFLANLNGNTGHCNVTGQSALNDPATAATANNNQASHPSPVFN